MIRCRDRDPMCPVCRGKCRRQAEYLVKRIDMDDISGTPMWADCTEDASESSLYRIYAIKKQAE